MLAVRVVVEHHAVTGEQLEAGLRVDDGRLRDHPGLAQVDDPHRAGAVVGDEQAAAGLHRAAQVLPGRAAQRYRRVAPGRGQVADAQHAAVGHQVDERAVRRPADLQPVARTQVQTEPGPPAAVGRVEDRGGAGGGVHHDRVAVGEHQQPGAGRGHATPAARLAVVDPHQVAGRRVQDPEPARVVQCGCLRADLRRQGYRCAARRQRLRIGRGDDPALAVHGVDRVGTRERLQPVARPGQRAGRRADLEGGAVDPADRAGAAVDRVPGGRLLHHVEPVAPGRDRNLRGHLRRGAVEQGELADLCGSQPGGAGAQLRPLGGVPAAHAEHEHTAGQDQRRGPRDHAPYRGARDHAPHPHHPQPSWSSFSAPRRRRRSRQAYTSGRGSNSARSARSMPRERRRSRRNWVDRSQASRTLSSSGSPG